MHREKGKSKALAYTNWHIGSLRMYFAYRECPKLFTYLETKASAKTGKKKRHKHKVLIFSVCAKKCGLRPEKTFLKKFMVITFLGLCTHVEPHRSEGKPWRSKNSMNFGLRCLNIIQKIIFCNQAWQTRTQLIKNSSNY